MYFIAHRCIWLRTIERDGSLTIFGTSKTSFGSKLNFGSVKETTLICSIPLMWDASSKNCIGFLRRAEFEIFFGFAGDLLEAFTK